MTNVLKYKDYIGSMEIDIDAGICHGRLLFIRDVISYSSETVSGLQAAFEEAVDDYLETAKEIGRAAEKPCSGSFNVRIPAELHMAANLAARSERVSLNALVKDAISARVGGAVVRHQHAHIVKIEAWHDDVRGSFSLEAGEITQWQH